MLGNHVKLLSMRYICNVRLFLERRKSVSRSGSVNSPRDRLPAELVGMQEEEMQKGSFDFSTREISVTAPANNFPQSAITINVRGIPTKAKKMQNILPQLVDGTTFPYPKI